LIADLRSLPRDDSHAVLRRPKQIGFAVGVALKNISIKNRCESVLLDNWRSIVGDKFYYRCSPVTILPSDVLIVSCCNGVIRSELELIKPIILSNISALPRCKHVKNVIFRLT
jgi:hypothetical protein